MLLLSTKERPLTRSRLVLFSICYRKEESEEKLWQIMHKLHKNQETRIMTKFGLTDTIVIEDNIRQGRTTDLGLQY